MMMFDEEKERNTTTFSTFFNHSNSPSTTISLHSPTFSLSIFFFISPTSLLIPYFSFHPHLFTPFTLSPPLSSPSTPLPPLPPSTPPPSPQEQNKSASLLSSSTSLSSPSSTTVARDARALETVILKMREACRVLRKQVCGGG